MKDLVTLFEDSYLRISMIDGDTGITTISVSSSPRIGEEFAKEEFVKTVSDDGRAIFFIDKTNSFGNNIDWDLVVDIISPYLAEQKVRTIGFCMGGFLAIVLSKFFSVSSVVAITPQYSIQEEYIDRSNFPAHMYTDKIEVWKIPTLKEYFSDTTEYYIMYSESQMDLDQIKHFPEQDNVHLINFGSEFTHSLPGQLGDSLPGLVRACFNSNLDYVKHFIADYYK